MSANRLDPGRTSSGGSDSDSGGSSGGGGASGSSRTTTPTRGRSSGSSSSPSGTGSTGTSSGGTTGSQTESELVRGRTGGSVGDSGTRTVDRIPGAGAEFTTSDLRDFGSDITDNVRDRPGGSAAAAGLGVAAVPEPTPVSETVGLGVAGTALAVGGAAEFARRNEIGVPSSPFRRQGEVSTPTSARRESEIGVGSGELSRAEFETPSSARFESEIGVPTGTAPGGEVEVPSVDAAQQVGIGQQPQRQIGEEEFIIGRETIEDTERTSDLEEGERMRQIREELERRQEFVRDDGQTFDGTRDPVRFPAEEGATGTAASFAEEFGFEPELTPEQALDTATLTQAGTEPPVSGLDSDSDTGGGVDVASATRLEPQQSLGTDTGPSTFEQPGTTTDPITDTTTGTGTATDTATATAQTQVQAQATGELAAVSDAFAQPELTAFETQFAQPTQTGPTNQQTTNRDPPRPPIPEADDSEPVDAFGVETDDDLFDTGFLSGDDAFEDAFGR